MKLFLTLTLLYISLSIGLSQDVQINGSVIDTSYTVGIEDVHIRNLNSAVVALSNEDGQFQIIASMGDTLLFSHIGYQDFRQIVDTEESHIDLNIYLSEINLEELTITALKIDPRKIVAAAIDRLSINHPLSKTTYRFFSRIVNADLDSTAINIIETLGHVAYQGKSACKFNMDKVRVLELDKSAPEERITSILKMNNDNLHRFTDDYLHKAKMKRYNYEYQGVVYINNRKCYKISFYTDRWTYYKQGLLYIDAKNYGIAQKDLLDKKGAILHSVKFQFVDSKWQLFRAIDNHENRNITTRITTYSPIKNDLEYSGISSKEFFADYENTNLDPVFWDGYTVIPIPDWVSSQLH